MELNGYRLLLPEGTLEYFDLVDVKESVNEVVIYLEEKNIVPEKYTDQDTESKGFYDPVIVQDFPLRGKKVFLNIRRRRWLLMKLSMDVSAMPGRPAAPANALSCNAVSTTALSGISPLALQKSKWAIRPTRP